MLVRRITGYRLFIQRRGFKDITDEIYQRSPRQKIFLRLMWAFPVTTLGLGYWQWERHKWKTGIIEKINKQMKFDAIDLPQDLTLLDDMEYRRVRVKGRFLHEKEQIVGPRVLLKKDGFKLLSAGENGYWVVTPFKLIDRPYSILVNRGWISKFQKDPNTRQEGQIEGEIELEGIVRKSEGKSKNLSFDRAGFWIRRDVDEIAKVCETAPVMIDADVDSTVPGGPIGGQTRVTLRNEHFNYMLTWLSMSALTAIMSFTKNYPHIANKVKFGNSLCTSDKFLNQVISRLV